MTVQIIEIAGNRMAILPEGGYRPAELASRIGMSNMTVSTMEKESRPGGVKVWRALSEAPNVAVEDRLPEV